MKIVALCMFIFFYCTVLYAKNQNITFFTDPSCETCHKVEIKLNDLRKDYSISYSKLSIYDDGVMNRLLSLEKKYSVTISQVPVVEIEGVGVIQGEVILTELEKTLQSSAVNNNDRSGLLSSGKFTLVTVAIAGLLDGINPCAFATIVFLILFLFSINKSRREILIVTLCFCVGVFLAYCALGLGLRAVLTQLYNVALVKNYINLVLAVILFVLSLWSFYDAWLYRKKGMITLRLPESWKQYINTFIIKRSKSGSLYAGSIVTGMIISVIEIACTGQIYIPVISYLIKNGDIHGYTYLFLYNVFFIIPLLVVGILVYTGMNKDGVRQLLSGSIGKSKIALGILFFVLAFLLL